ncbi:RNA polymerase sigma-70 factor (ECF subfamily) [Frondihabitans sp. PhB188]|uniref:sigma-70 family RNA polymerase sigma factor n=1 Tax=Frondihabitans sp. PhB188 TaxID=2485200 RepID=UPI000F47FD80|nr:sigma-70 family RNA polymerase sigma factor [Frondihabitans sp. PhB188]ROQ39769.1 RNA polymerase sigma-70 factor (ECF subfamily) [Frondihabitans sp. PhB188]
MRGDHSELLSAIHDTHAPALQRYVSRLTNDPALAEDIVQESLLRLWKNTRLLEGDDLSARRWLFTVARNLVVDDARSAHHRHEFPTDLLPERATADETDASLSKWLLQDAMKSLTREHRQVIVGAYHLGMSIADLADQAGVPPGTIKSRLHYALRALRLALQERGVTQ